MLSLFSLIFVLQSEVQDSTNAGYQLGLQIGSYIPVAIIIIIAIVVIKKQYKH